MKTTAADLLRKHLPTILGTNDVAVPDNEEEMNWRLFFAHSQDMQGFRADIFTGGPNEAKHPSDPTFRGLRDRWGRDSRSLITDLARLWDDPSTRAELKRRSHPHAPREVKLEGVRPAIKLLSQSGIPGAQVFAETLNALHGDKIAHKTNRMIRAYAENSHRLAQHGCSYRAYLRSVVPAGPFPPADILAPEKLWVQAIERDFYNVGPALANYMISDWLLGLWRARRIDWFESYKEDSVHQKAIDAGKIEMNPAQKFVAYCRELRIPPCSAPVSGQRCPPRVLNECIWMEFNALAAASAH